MRNLITFSLAAAASTVITWAILYHAEAAVLATLSGG